MKQLKNKRGLFALFIAFAASIPTFAQNSADTLQVPDVQVTKGFKGNRAIGFATQPTKHITSAIATVNGSDIEKNFNVNLGNALYGRLAGLSVTQGNSEPGLATPGMLVRGVNTMGGASTAPLFVIDGFISSGLGTANAFMQLVPEEIETITVLKDASATAVYGARAANGVILVTTKAAKAGAFKVNFTTRQGFNQAQYLPKFLDSYNYATLFNEALANDGLAPRYMQEDLEAYKTGSDPFFHPNVNWYNEVLRKVAPVSSYNLSFNGGDNFARYYVVLNAITSQGLFKKFGNQEAESSNSNYVRYNFRSNVEVNLSKRLKVDFRIAGSVEQKKNPFEYNTGNTFSLLQSLAPNSFPVYNPNGSFGGNAARSNPVANLLSTGFSQSNSRTILSSLKLTHELDMIAKGLSVSGVVSINNYFESGSRKTKQYPRFSISKNALGDTVYSPAIGQLTSLAGSEQTLDQYRSMIVQAFLNYQRSIGKSDITAMAMFNSDNVTLFGPDSDPSSPTANSTDAYKHNNGSGRFTYAYDDKYIAEVSASYMGSEIFPPGKQYGWFPAASVGWVLSQENFLKNNKHLNFLKLRGSYGLVGNDIIASRGLSTRYAFTPTFGAGGYWFGTANNGTGGFAENAIANNNVTWEKEKVTNIGIDATFLNNFDLSVDYFKRDRYDILVASNSTIPGFLGVITPNLNQGKTSNNGVDVNLRYSNNPKAKLRFFVEANASYFTNKIIFNAEALQINTKLYSTGNRIGQPFGLMAIGFYSEADIAQRQVDPKSVPGVLTEIIRAGDIKYADIGGPEGKPDGVIDGNDRMPIGNPGLPRFSAGLHTGLAYNGFDLDLVFQGVSGNTIAYTGNVFHAFQGNGQVGPIALGRWTPETAATATYPRLSSKDNLNNYQYSTFWQRDGSFIKLRSAEIGYTLPENIINKLKLSSTRFFINGTNLFSIDKIEYGDPESLAVYPVTRTLSIGAKIQL